MIPRQTERILSPNELRESLPPRLLQIAEEILAAGGQAFLVGGWVRDAMLGRASRDYDIEVYGLDQNQLLELLKRHGKPNLVGKSYGVIHLASRGQHFDFSFPRLESKTGVGHRAFTVETRPNLDFYTAALRRDFTINAMGMSLPDLELVDPHGGLQDLEHHLLRHVSSAFVEDPLRVLRAVQFSARFQLSIFPETVTLCQTLDLKELSRERFYEEFRKWLTKSEKPSFGLNAFRILDLGRFFPWITPRTESHWVQLGNLIDDAVAFEFPSELDRLVFLYTILCEYCESEQSVHAFLDALTNEIQILRQVPVLWREGPFLNQAIQNRQALHAPFLRRQSLRYSLSHTLAWVRVHRMRSSEDSKSCVDEVESLARELGILENPLQPLLTGKMLMELGQRPGKHFGEWIAECFEEQIEGRIATTEDALAWAKQKINASGIS